MDLTLKELVERIPAYMPELHWAIWLVIGVYVIGLFMTRWWVRKALKSPNQGGWNKGGNGDCPIELAALASFVFSPVVVPLVLFWQFVVAGIPQETRDRL